MLNPLGVPSRMNIGQVLETHLGYGRQVAKAGIDRTPVFDGASEKDIIELLNECGYPESEKLILRDGRTAKPFDNPVTVGYMYMLKLPSSGGRQDPCQKHRPLFTRNPAAPWAAKRSSADSVLERWKSGRLKLMARPILFRRS